jgi:Concanavalin A-like lectin/glucanases superfamily
MLSSLSDSYWAGRRIPSGSKNPVVTDGLVMFVDALNTSSYQTNSLQIATWYDISGNNNHLTIVNTQTVTHSVQGYFRTGPSNKPNNQCGFFTRSTGTNIPIGDQPYSIGVWARQPFFWAQSAGLISIGGYGVANNANELRTDQSVNGQFRHLWWTNDLLALDSKIKLNQWFLVIAEYDGTHRSVYINGQQFAQDVPGVPHQVSTSTIFVSRIADPYAFRQQGDVAQAFIYNRALTPNEISKIFLATRGRFAV